MLEKRGDKRGEGGDTRLSSFEASLVFLTQLGGTAILISNEPPWVLGIRKNLGTSYIRKFRQKRVTNIYQREKYVLFIKRHNNKTKSYWKEEIATSVEF